MKLLIITFLIGFSQAVSGCADISPPTQSPMLPANAVELINAGPHGTEAFPYKAYPKEVLVQYDDKDAVSKARASTKAKGLPFWDESILAQYKADISTARERIFSAQLGEGLKIISASSVVPQATLLVLNKETLEWLNANPEITRLWLDANPRVYPIGTADAR